MFSLDRESSGKAVDAGSEKRGMKRGQTNFGVLLVRNVFCYARAAILVTGFEFFVF